MLVKRKSSVRLEVEALESRWVPAGNITTQLTEIDFIGDHALLLKGDNAANALRLVHVSESEVQIIGEDSTLIDGQPTKTIILTDEGDVIRTVSIDLGNGDDTVTQEVPDELYPLWYEPLWTEIQTGLGDDSVTVSANRIGNLMIDTGKGNDSVVISAVPDDPVDWSYIRIDTGDGDDVVHIQTNADDPNAAFIRSCKIEAGWGDDIVRFEGTFTIGGRFDSLGFFINFDQGDDTLTGDPDSPPIQKAFPSLGFTAHGGDGYDTVENGEFFGQWIFELGRTFEEVN